MSNISSQIEKCPCGSGANFAACCQPYIDGKLLAPEPEVLMRSRYTAFSRGDLKYLLDTWHPETVPELDQDEPSNWISLEIIESGIDETGTYGEVEFIAKLILGDKLEVLHEVSEFEKIDGRWLYHSGEFKNDLSKTQTITMKAPCPCGSGEKFKHCHFRS
jgi:SEC-C motif-containing protein